MRAGRFIASLLLPGFLACCCGAHAQPAASTSSGQAYPNKSIRVIISDAAGGAGCDFIMRLIGAKFAERTGQGFIADNRPGASGQIGLQLLTQAPRDGYTIGCGRGGNMVIVPLAHKKVAYDSLKDFAPIAQLTSNFLALAVHPNVPAKTTKELIAHAKANPGKLSFGTNGEGDFLHFATELFRKEAGFTYLHVPFKSAVLPDLVGGRIDAAVNTFGGILPFAQAGRLRLLGIAREKRSPLYPDYPTLAETVPGYASGGWFGAIAPAGVRADVIALLNREMNAIMKMPDVIEKTTFLGLDTYTESPAYFAQTIRSDIEKWGRLARDIGFKPQ